jgi:putative flippase GtrA
MVLQLTAIFVFNSWAGGHYLVTSAAAIELTLLHNFVWHLHYTWERAHLPVIPSNCIAILCCSTLNFCLGNWWAFAEGPRCHAPEIR